MGGVETRRADVGPDVGPDVWAEWGPQELM